MEQLVTGGRPTGKAVTWRRRRAGSTADGQAGGMRRFSSAPVTEVRYDHAEGPVWDDRGGGSLLWLDQHVGQVHLGEWAAEAGRIRPARSFAFGASVGAAVPMRDPDGGWVLASGRGFARLRTDGTVEQLARPEA